MWNVKWCVLASYKMEELRIYAEITFAPIAISRLFPSHCKQHRSIPHLLTTCSEIVSMVLKRITCYTAYDILLKSLSLQSLLSGYVCGTRVSQRRDLPIEITCLFSPPLLQSGEIGEKGISGELSCLHSISFQLPASGCQCIALLLMDTKQ